MISIIIPVVNAEKTLARAFAPLVRPMSTGLIKEVIVVDGGSTDNTKEIVEDAGARFLEVKGNRGALMRAGATESRGRWLLFLDPETLIEDRWDKAAKSFMQKTGAVARAGVFRLQVEEDGFAARYVELASAMRSLFLRLPHSDQCFLVSRALYEEAGGHRDLPSWEATDLAKKIGWGRMRTIPVYVSSKVADHTREGWFGRTVSNAGRLMLISAGVAIEKIVNMPEQKSDNAPT